MRRLIGCFICLCCVGFIGASSNVFARDLDEIRRSGVLRHLGVPYANFVKAGGKGMSVAIIKRFAEHIDVEYEFIESSWENIIPGLIGWDIKVKGNEVELLNKVAVKGDLISSGLTIIPWRKKIIDFSAPIFPTQIWLISKKGSSLNPIKTSGEIGADINKVKSLLKNHSIMGKANTCLDPTLYGLTKNITLFNGEVGNIASAIKNGEADTAILDVPDTLIALRHKDNVIQVLGPISEKQFMAAGFSKDSADLRIAFDAYLKKNKKRWDIL